jgi:hypothetical protein
MKRLLALSGVVLTTGLAAPAFAAPPASMPTGGRTLAGPGTTTILASAEETILAGLPGNDVCATVTNSGNAAVTLTMVGGGTSQVSIPSRKTLALCRDNATSIALTCQAVGNGTCTATWRVDDL